MLFTLLLACNTAPNIEGIWAILLPAADGATCQATITHNFLNGEVPDEVQEESAWQTSSDTTTSQGLLLVDIVASSRKGATLVQGDRLFPGSRTDEGAWVFNWMGSQTQTDVQSHELGYDYVYDRVDETETTYSLVFDSDILTGTFSATQWADEEWYESDTWPESAVEAGDTGDIPASSWLVHVDGGTVSNTRIESDCTTNDCVLAVTNDCGEDRSITGFRTGYEADDAYDHLAQTGQDQGT